LQQTVRPLVVRRRNRCWDVVPRVLLSQHTGGYGCCSLATTGLRIIMMWRSSMSRAAGWPVDGYPKGWTESLGCMR